MFGLKERQISAFMIVKALSISIKRVFNDLTDEGLPEGSDGSLIEFKCTHYSVLMVHIFESLFLCATLNPEV